MWPLQRCCLRQPLLLTFAAIITSGRGSHPPVIRHGAITRRAGGDSPVWNRVLAGVTCAMSVLLREPAFNRAAPFCRGRPASFSRACRYTLASNWASPQSSCSHPALVHPSIRFRQTQLPFHKTRFRLTVTRGSSCSHLALVRPSIRFRREQLSSHRTRLRSRLALLPCPQFRRRLTATRPSCL